ncbi:cytochrome b5 domain-containing protein 1 [Copidosoma floridanum]|uniref:cytochrome b5 domain-containing protein 1 n=1 Tax=Copidosoma floridanum TaxID=29053 RepID=UPI0006C9D510|nr:cytochrome b5 domain-containing protein 1 [Copidosoma floridanum]
MAEQAGRLPYFLPTEVAMHSTAQDCWLSCLGGVYDLTSYIALNPESLICKYLLAHAGRDVSHWFDARIFGRKRLRRYVEPATGLWRILLPYSNPMPEGVQQSELEEDCDCSWHGSQGLAESDNLFKRPLGILIPS